MIPMLTPDLLTPKIAGQVLEGFPRFFNRATPWCPVPGLRYNFKKDRKGIELEVYGTYNYSIPGVYKPTNITVNGLV
jgi:hypothetical protein